MDSVLDIIATVPCTPTPPVCIDPPSQPSQTRVTPEPRFKVDQILDFFIEDDVLYYWVLWEGENKPKPEVYENLHHLTVFHAFERRIRPRPNSTKRTATNVTFQERKERYKRYLIFRDGERSKLKEEYDTSSDEDRDQVITAPLQQLFDSPPQQLFEASPLGNFSSDDSLSWGDLLVNLEDERYMSSSMDLTGSFGQAGPSHLGERRRGGARTASSWDDFATKQ
jgi:hypothetical protein